MYFLFSEVKRNLLRSQQQKPSETFPQYTESLISEHPHFPNLERILIRMYLQQKILFNLNLFNCTSRETEIMTTDKSLHRKSWLPRTKRRETGEPHDNCGRRYLHFPKALDNHGGLMHNYMFRMGQTSVVIYGTVLMIRPLYVLYGANPALCT